MSEHPTQQAWRSFPNLSGRWLTIAVEGDVIWTNNVETIRYRGFDVWVLPPLDLVQSDNVMRLPLVKCARQIAFDVPGQMTLDEGWRLLFRFLSSLCWHSDRPVIAADRLGPGSRLIPIGGVQLRPFYGRDEFPYNTLPAPNAHNACSALALYREGRSSNSDAYAYLNYFRVLDIVAPGKQSIDWINDNLSALKPKSPFFSEGVPRDLHGKRSVGEFLYGLGRSSVAHAKVGEPHIDPDEPAHALRLSREVVVVRELAAHAIVSVLNVPRH